MGATFSSPVQTGPGVHAASCTMGTGSFPGVNRSGRGADHPPNLVARLRKSRAIPQPSGPSGLSRSTFTLLTQTGTFIPNFQSYIVSSSHMFRLEQLEPSSRRLQLYQPKHVAARYDILYHLKYISINHPTESCVRLHYRQIILP
jgi:hypothetical protein